MHYTTQICTILDFVFDILLSLEIALLRTVYWNQPHYFYYSMYKIEKNKIFKNKDYADIKYNFIYTQIIQTPQLQFVMYRSVT